MKKIDLITQYEQNSIAKMKLGEIVECFKGKAVSKTSETGQFGLINLSDMATLGIAYQSLKKIDGQARSLQRYFLQDGDVLVASKGTVKKVAVFEEQSYLVLASANITVLRPTADVSGAYLSLFLSSEVGQALLDTADTGKNVMNINTEKLLSIEIPRLPLVKQTYLVQRYYQGLQDYKRRLERAEQEWQRIKSDVTKNLF